MAIHNSVVADTKADIYGVIADGGTIITCMGDSVRGDMVPVDFLYDENSAATDNFPEVIKPTSQSGNGRYVKTLYQQYQADWNQSTTTSMDFVKNKPTITAPKAYQGITQRSGAFPIFKSATVSSGAAAFHLTNDGLSTGTALFPNGVIDESVNVFVSDATASYQMSYAMTNSNKTLTVTANKLTTANILTGILGQAAANGAVVKLQIWGY